MKRIGKVHLIIPDVQVRPGVPTDHLSWIANYVIEKRPDVIVCLGDFSDVVSLNSYNVGKAAAEGKTVLEDVRITKLAMDRLMSPIKKVKGYNPELVLTLGNHEDRIDREAECNPRYRGWLSTKDLQYEKWGWKVHPFLKVVKVDGIEYVHYFTSGVMGRSVTKASAILQHRQCSGVMGHVQYTDIAFHPKTGNFAMMAGLCNLHDEDYLGPQGNNNRRQIVVLNEVQNGTADPMLVSLEFLRRKYG